MEDQGRQDSHSPGHGSASGQRNEPVRSRWTPKPEQILILESIFNSGMVNPPKDETVRIRKLLEKFGAVGDANVFYWFQNRRSRSRRRQRQLQASLEQRNQLINHQPGSATAPYETAASSNNSDSVGTGASSLCYNNSLPCPSPLTGSPSTCGAAADQEASGESYFPVTGLSFQEIDHNSAASSSVLYASDASNVHYRSGFITVFINGIPTEVHRGAVDTRTMLGLGQDVVLVHSSGVPVPTNEFGLLMQGLQHGESYFVVPRAT